MLLLAFDTSTPAVTVALIDGDSTLLAAREVVATNRHGELLAPLIAEVLAEADAEPADLTAIAVGLGPGPFTGLRVGIMSAKSMADALRIPVYGECSLDVIGCELRDSAVNPASADPSYVVMSDARRKQVYWATYDGRGERVDGPEIDTPANLAERLGSTVGLAGGAGALLYRDQFTGLVISERAPYPSARTLAELVVARAHRGAASDDLTPLYLRRPDAQLPGAPKRVTPV